MADILTGNQPTLAESNCSSIVFLIGNIYSQTPNANKVIFFVLTKMCFAFLSVPETQLEYTGILPNQRTVSIDVVSFNIKFHLMCSILFLTSIL